MFSQRRLYYTIKIASIYPIDRPFDLYGYRTKISLVVLPLDVLNLCVLQGIVLLRKYAHKSYTYIPRPHTKKNWKQTYLLYYMLDILITFCVTIYKLCNSSRRHQILSLYRIYHNDNTISAINGKEGKRIKFNYKTKEMMADVGKRSGVAIIYGIKLHGIIAWWIWRAYYLVNMPTISKKLEVMVDWTSHQFFKRDIAMIKRVIRDTPRKPVSKTSINQDKAISRK